MSTEEVAFDSRSNIIERVINMRIEQGFIDEHLRPLKCRLCKSKNVKDFDIYQEGHGVIEFGVMCSDCGAHLGHWNCGKWNIDYIL